MNGSITPSDSGLRHTDDKGTTTSYWFASSMYVTAENFSVNWNMVAGAPIELKPVIRAKAKLYDRSISIIGESEKQATEVDLAIRERQSGSGQAPPDQPNDVTLGDASLGYTPADWEFNQVESWWLECKVDKVALGQLVRHIERGSAASIELAVQCANLYQDDPPIAPPSARKQLFLKPSSSSGGWTEPAEGEIRVLTITPSSAARHKEDRPSLSAETFDNGLKFSIDRLRSTIQMVGVFLVAAVAAIAWR